MIRKLNYLLVALIGVIFLVPLVWTITTSLTPSGEMVSSRQLFSAFTPTFDNFKHAWDSAPFVKYYTNTIIIVTVILVVQFFTITLAAYAFARLRFFGQGVLFILFLTQIMIPPDILIFPNYTIIGDLGLINTKLAVMLPYFASAFGTFLLRQTFKQVPADLEEAAKMDGCNWWKVLWHVYIPVAKPTYIAFSLITISAQWSNFMWPLIVTNTVDSRPLTVGMAVFAQSFETGAQWGTVTAATIMVIFPLLIAFFVFQKQFVASFMHSGIK